MKFGRPLRRLWCLDPEVTYLNHGTVGAPPRSVLDAQQKIRDAVEAQPSKYLLRNLSGLLGLPPETVPKIRSAATAIAKFLGAEGDDLVFVDNATTGANAVLASFPLKEGDQILLTDHTYGAVANAARFVAERNGARVGLANLPHPIADAQEVVAAIEEALEPSTRLLVIDHITSESAMVLPIQEIAASCRRAGVAILVDGAHAPGALNLDLPSLGVDWYTGNLHKWAWAPRSSAILWAAPDRQEDLHPPVISWGLGHGFQAEFDWVGTRDPSSFLASADAIELMRNTSLAAIRDYNHSLAWSGAIQISTRLGTTIPVPESMVASMVTVPLPRDLGETPEDATRLRDTLLFEDRIEVQLHSWKSQLWVRISAQIYNDMADMEQLSAALQARRSSKH